jgi:hypothetical protein
VNATPEPPSRFHASPAEIDAFLRQNFAEDVLLNFYRAAGDEVLDEITASGKQFRGLAETKGGKHVYLAGMDDVLTHIWDDRYYPAQLPDMASYDLPFNPSRTVAEWGLLKDAQARQELLSEPDLVPVTIREVPGGWIACKDNDRNQVVAESVVFQDVELRLSALPYPVIVTEILRVTEDTPAPEPQGFPCYRTKVHEPHQWLKGRKAVPCPGIPEEN